MLQGVKETRRVLVILIERLRVHEILIYRFFIYSMGILINRRNILVKLLTSCLTHWKVNLLVGLMNFYIFIYNICIIYLPID